MYSSENGNMIDFILWPWHQLQAVWYWLFPERFPGTPCYVLAHFGNTIEFRDAGITDPHSFIIKDSNTGKMLIEKREGPGADGASLINGSRITYRWIDGELHSFLADLNNPVSHRNGLPVFPHNVGSLYQAGASETFISSQLFVKLMDTNIIEEGLDALKKYEKAGNIPWVKYAVWAAVILLVIFLWKNGTIPGLLHSLGVGASANVTGNITAPAAPAIPSPTAPLNITPQ